jgi:flagellar biosynthesis/type III secretory pathway protein FliH
MKFRDRETENRSRLAKRLWILRKKCLKSQRTQVNQKEQLLQLHLEQRYRETYVKALHQAEEKSIALALEIAQTILCSEVSESTKSVTARVKKALRELAHETWFEIRASSREAEILKEEYQNLKHIKILASPNQDSGTVVIKTTSGTSEMNWKAHFETIKEALLRDSSDLLPPSSSHEEN